ncbi:mitogen-activated protein kinase kinase kinase, partial [Tremellales sp. Uapishka_1]
MMLTDQPLPTPARRPQGARRRAHIPGLFIANPDNSDEERERSSIRSARSGSGSASPITGRMNPLPSIPTSSSSPLPTIPAPNSSPLPTVSTFSSSVPPQPPPQPTRHFTTPVPSRPHETSSHAAPASPTRALPPLPPISASARSASPPSHITIPSPQAGPHSTHTPHSLPPLPPPNYPPPSPYDNRPRNNYPHIQTLDRIASPEDMLSPASSDVGRARSGSLQNLKTLLQVTTDNEQFTLVDITGVATAEGIRERVFSKLHFRDDDYPTLTMFKTNIGEDPDPAALSPAALLQLCSTQGDSKASLKFLVTQTSLSGSSAAVPPPSIGVDIEAVPLYNPVGSRAPNDWSRNGKPSSRHSKDGSMSSASEIFASQSDVGDDIDYENWTASGLAQIRRGTRGELKTARVKRLGSSNSSSRSPLTDTAVSVETSSPAIPTPAHSQGVSVSSTSSPTHRSWVVLDLPSPPTAHLSTPTPAATTRFAPVSAHEGDAGPSRPTGLGLDMDEASRVLIEQLQREEMEAIAETQRKLREDEQMALREQQDERAIWTFIQQSKFEEQVKKQRQIEQDERAARELAEHDRQKDDARARRQPSADRTAAFSDDRRRRREMYQNRGMDPEGTIGNWMLSQSPATSTAPRPSESHHDAPPLQTYATNPIFDQPIYQSPPAQYSPQVNGSAYAPNNRRPSGFPITDTFAQQAHATGRLNDPRLVQASGRSPVAARGSSQTLPIRRGGAPHLHPFASPAEEDQRPGLSGRRSMGNLAYANPVRPSPYPNVPPRAAITPSPGQYTGNRSYRTSSQDGRYPEPAQGVPRRLPPSNPGYNEGVVPFPSPQVTGSTVRRVFAPPPALDATSSRPQTVHLERSPPPPSSPPHTATRPSTLHIENEYVEPYPAARPRSGSASASFGNVRSPSPGSGARRVSDTSADSSLLPYHGGWLNVPRPDVRDTDTASVAGTISSTYSDATTIRARTASTDEDDSVNTVRAEDWARQLDAMSDGRFFRPPPSRYILDNDGDGTAEDEASLFVFPATARTKSPAPLDRSNAMRPSGLTIDTAPVTHHHDQPARSATTPSDSATESEGTEDGHVRRSKSFAKPKGDWLMRPDTGELYDNIDDFFPRIDLDKPIVEGLPSTPSTPSAESPRVLDAPKPPQPTPKPAFNKNENRRSIRYVTDQMKKNLNLAREKTGLASASTRTVQDQRKLERRRSSSMWGHVVVEVTPSKFAEGQIPSAIPESPSADGKPATLNWVKGELIGKGSYGRVYVALNVTTGDMMAVKQVEMPATDRDKHDRRQIGMVDALKSEIALLKDLFHPNIVAYLGCETAEDYLSIFLEYVPGGTIASIYRTPGQGRFEEQLVKYFTRQILDGLAYLHAKNIWHRDLKGDNILVDQNGVCKISDFGISKQTADAYESFGQATNMKGSVFWMAPEVVHAPNQKGYSGKVDIWSLGCVVLEMWTGKRPWGEMEQVAAMFELFNKRARPPLPPDIHLSKVALDFLNDKCLAKNPRDRPMATDLLRHQFIQDVDPKWNFAESKIGKAVAKNKAKTIKAGDRG